RTSGFALRTRNPTISTNRLTITQYSGKFNPMVERQPRTPPAEPARLDELFRPLAAGTRRAMLRRLAVGERTIGELAAPYDMSFEAASKHLRVLERAGL